MLTAIKSLKAQLEKTRTLTPKNELGDLVTFSMFPKLTKLLSKLELSSQNKEKQPTQSRIEQAIIKFKQNSSSLNRSDWRYVFWGLNSKMESELSLLECDTSFTIIQKKVNRMIIDKDITRGIWFALCASYFSYPNGPEKNNKKLQYLLVKSFNAIEQDTSIRQRPWISLVKKNEFLLTPLASKEFLKIIIRKEGDHMSEIDSTFHIDGDSWLWKSVFHESATPNLLSTLQEVDDEKFDKLIPDLVTLIEKYPVHKFAIFTHILERYRLSEKYQDSNTQLKEIALDLNMWGSPQLADNKKKWERYVTPDVLRMVLNWFAKDDLVHFFKLLRAADSYVVDERRLDFWLNFIDHISFTRIVMGNDVKMNKSYEFEDFKNANKSRLSELVNSDNSINAFIIRIKDYWFVEFSKTGSACYIYDDKNKPFVVKPKLKYKDELKVLSIAKSRILHQGDWENKARDYFINELKLDI